MTSTKHAYLLCTCLLCMLIFSSCYQEKKGLTTPTSSQMEKQSLKSVEVIFSDTLETIDPITKKLKKEIQERKEEVYTIPRILPVFPGCKIQTDIEKTYLCSKQHLTYFVSQNLNYPKEAIKKGLKGVSVVQFIIDEKGIPTNEKIVKSLGLGTDEAVLNIIRKMRTDKLTWIPGKVRGESVKVLHTLPVKFSLQ